MSFQKILQLAFLNLKTRKTRTLLTVLSMSVGITVLFFFLSLSNALRISLFEEINSIFNPRQLIVSYNYSNLGIFELQNNKALRLNNEVVESIQQIEGVEKVVPQITSKIPTMIEIDFWDKYFQTDTPVYGIDFDFLNLQKDDFEEEYLPVVVSEQILTVYNSSLSESMGLPRLSAEGLIGRRLDLIFGKSSFFNQGTSKTKRVPAKIVGLSPLVPVVGITIPVDRLQSILNELAEKNQEDLKYSSLYLLSEDPKFNTQIQTAIEKMGFRVNSAQIAQAQISQILFYLELILKIIAAVILLISLFAMNNTLMMSILERKQEIGILKALGMQARSLAFLIISEAFLIGLSSIFFGFFLGYFSSFILDFYLLKILPDFIFKPESFFVYNFSIFLFVFLFTFLFLLLVTFFPVRQITKLDPLEAILK